MQSQSAPFQEASGGPKSRRPCAARKCLRARRFRKRQAVTERSWLMLNSCLRARRFRKRQADRYSPDESDGDPVSERAVSGSVRRKGDDDDDAGEEVSERAVSGSVRRLCTPTADLGSIGLRARRFRKRQAVT